MSNPNTDTNVQSKVDNNAKTNLTQSIQTALSQLEHAYNPAEVEAGMYQGWEDSGYFKPVIRKKGAVASSNKRTYDSTL